MIQLSSSGWTFYLSALNLVLDQDSLVLNVQISFLSRKLEILNHFHRWIQHFRELIYLLFFFSLPNEYPKSRGFILLYFNVCSKGLLRGLISILLIKPFHLSFNKIISSLFIKLFEINSNA